MENENMVAIGDLSKAAVLAALYNRAEPLGMGFLHYDPTPMTVEQAQVLIDDNPGNLRVDYLAGRCMKVDLSGDEFDPWGFDREYGKGEAQSVIYLLRQAGETDNLAMRMAQEQGVRENADKAHEFADTPSTASYIDGVPTFFLGGNDVGEELHRAITRAINRVVEEKKEEDK